MISSRKMKLVGSIVERPSKNFGGKNIDSGQESCKDTAWPFLFLLLVLDALVGVAYQFRTYRMCKLSQLRHISDFKVMINLGFNKTILRSKF